MMKSLNAFGPVIGMCCLVLGGRVALAAEPVAPKTEAQAEAPMPAPTEEKSETEKAREQARAKLEGTAWHLELKPLGGAGKGQKDTLTFKGRQVTSERLTKAGYGSSNYSLTVGDDLSVVWETMQTKEGAGPAFWRGELAGDLMRGTLSQQTLDGPATDFSFSGALTGAMEVSAPVPAPPAPKEQPGR